MLYSVCMCMFISALTEDFTVVLCTVVVHAAWYVLCPLLLREFTQVCILALDFSCLSEGIPGYSGNYICMASVVGHLQSVHVKRLKFPCT